MIRTPDTGPETIGADSRSVSPQARQTSGGVSRRLATTPPQHVLATGAWSSLCYVWMLSAHIYLISVYSTSGRPSAFARTRREADCESQVCTVDAARVQQ